MASKPATKRAKPLTKAQKQANKAAKAKEKQTGMYANDIGTLQTAFERNMPAALAFEARNRPAYTGLNLGDVSAFTQGVGGQAGYYDQLRNATSEAGRMIGDARSAELGQMTGQAGQARGLMQEMSPEAAARVQQAQDQAVQAQGLAGTYQGQSQGYVDQARDIAMEARGLPGLYQAKSQGYVDQANIIGGEAFARRGYLSPEQMRNAEQQARAGAQAAGRIGGNLGIASEVLNRENALAARRNEATTAGQNAFNQFGTQQNALSNLRGEAQNAGLNAFNQFQAQQGTMGNLRGEAQNANLGAYNMGQQFYSQPGLQLLGSTPLSYQTGQQNLGVGLGQIGAATPKLFDAGAALNLGATERANKLAKEAADAQAKAAKSAATLGLVGDVFKGATSMFSFGV
jgi:hypothetical protein